jgi:hypothetical protein
MRLLVWIGSAAVLPALVRALPRCGSNKVSPELRHGFVGAAIKCCELGPVSSLCVSGEPDDGVVIDVDLDPMLPPAAAAPGTVLVCCFLLFLFCFVLFCLSLCCLFRPHTHPLGVNNIAVESESFFFKSGTAGVAVRSTVRGATTATAIAAAPSRKNATTTTRLTTAVAGAQDNFKVQLSKSFPVARFSGTTGDGRASYAGQLGWWGVLLQGFFFFVDFWLFFF